VGHFSAAMKVRSGLVTADDETHNENRSASMKRNEKQVTDLISHLQEKMINPFDIQQNPPELINVSTGLKASTEVIIHVGHKKEWEHRTNRTQMH
jgi:cytochrome c556